MTRCLISPLYAIHSGRQCTVHNAHSLTYSPVWLLRSSYGCFDLISQVPHFYTNCIISWVAFNFIISWTWKKPQWFCLHSNELNATPLKWSNFCICSSSFYVQHTILHDLMHDESMSANNSPLSADESVIATPHHVWSDDEDDNIPSGDVDSVWCLFSLPSSCLWWCRWWWIMGGWWQY